MNSSNDDDQEATFEATAFVPPKPSRRKPLNRMTDNDRSPRRRRITHSSSPKQNHNYLDDDGSDISSDDSEEYEKDEDTTESGSPNYVPEKFDPTSMDVDGGNRRNSPNWQSDIFSQGKQPTTPKTPINVTYNITISQNYETSENKSSRLHSYKNIESPQENPSKISRQSTPRRNSNLKGKQPKEQRTNGINPLRCLSCFIVLISVLVWFTPFWMDTVVSSTIIPAMLTGRSERMTNFRNEIKAMKNIFPGQDRRTWIQIQAGVADVINRPQKPWMFVLFSNATRELRCLAEMLGKASSKALLSKDSLSLKPEDIGDEYGNIIDRLRSKITERKAVVVHDLLNVDPRAIQAFHTMCDRENPLVEEAVYILTIITQDYVPGFQSPEQFVENQLTNRFINKVPDDKLQPLITRLTDGSIIPVTPEVSLTGCTV